MAGPESLRLFVALDLPEAARDGAGGVPRRARTGACGGRCPTRRCTSRWRSSGTRPAADIDGGGRPCCERGRRGAARCALGAPLLLPPRRARVLCVAVRDDRRRARRAAGARRSPDWRPPASTRPSAGRSGRTRPSARLRAGARATALRRRRAGPQPLRVPRRGAHALPLPPASARRALRAAGAGRAHDARSASLIGSSRSTCTHSAAWVQSRSDGRDAHTHEAPRNDRVPRRAGRAGVPAGASAELDFKPCPGAPGPRCATLRVPLDRTRRAPGEVPLRIARLHSPAARPTLVYLSGGPGGAGIEEMLSVHAARARSSRCATALVGFDQRGTGASGLLRCPALERDLRLRSVRPARSARAGWATRAATTARRTRSRTSRRSARRSASSRITLFGISYGTELALAYARAHPDRVDRMILDSVVDPDDRDPFGLAGFRAMGPSLAGMCPAGAAGSAPTRRPTWLRSPRGCA